MDEPLSNLDATLRVKTRSELVAMHRELATTFIYVTHDQVEAMTMASRVAVMQKGRLQQIGSPQSVYEKPANTFVAQFIGSPPMNIVAGDVRREGELLGVDVAGGRIVLPPEHAAALARLGLERVLVGVRPEHLEIGEGPVRASVRAVESLGHERHILCDLSPDQMVIVRISADVPPPAAGDVVQLTADPQHLHLFDAATTRRIGA